ncbi:MAG TPA: conjugal transfer protein TraG [Hyphomonas sp.]|uniref:IncP-type conjugal transfer protein TraG n=1 Tax=Hyphomonas sp. UBA5107 TaxID=1946636 RepID=UPI000C404B39|nr:IncP-type conjugal transfer protein TraG [Hyphomonas sp. UBA5107]MAA82139.1 conjugal transfer protein TraG [Hyphomonas sp.]HBL93927.1 conjugal transfer protein TraG [Hyphomonas sp.]HCJ16217.1 conjugal transfer protein TraG [Hyphomonas sp.]HCN93481.1 conjugal transfer protein TraG [Hyphomonas sp.]|tara:strand:- start:4385 stop:6349 length:1965 start_codon:yes stop_codon:yes gene_type:complete
MSPSKILIGQFLIVLTIIVLTMWGATQWTAYELGYQRGLGRPWFLLDGWPVYKPWRLFQWWYAYEAYAPIVFAKGGAIAASGGLLGIVAAVIGSVWRSRWERGVTTYGSARWAEKTDLVKAELLGGDGVFLGQFEGQYLRHDGPEHVMAFAPTRSGKGVGLVVPTLLSWTGSAVIHDIKGENWQLTSGWRSQLGPCIRFDPTDELSPRYNPLLEVRKGRFEVRDVQNIADILVDPVGSHESRDHWDKTGYALLVAVMLHVLYAEENKSLAGCAEFLSHPERTIAQTLQTMLTTQHLVDAGGISRVHPYVARGARAMKNKSDNERSGVLSTVLTLLEVFSDPIIADLTSTSDWGVMDLVEAERPVSLYLVVPPSDISRTRPLMRLILNQVGRRLTERLPDPCRRKVLLMLDEFPALGRLDFFETALAFLAGYGIRAFLIGQSLNQIEKAYGPSNAILDNCHVRVAFATNDERTAKRISESLGAKTELRSQKNYTGHRLSPWLSHMMVSRQETARQLMTPGEVMQMPPEREVVMVAGVPPVMADKLRYYEDRNFIPRVLAPAPSAIEPIGQRIHWQEPGAAQICPAGAMTVTGQESGGRERSVDLGFPDKTASPEPEPEIGIKPEEGVQPDLDEALETVRRAATLDVADDKTLPGF